MSQDNVEAFKRAVDALNSGDVEAVLKAVHPAVEFHAFMEELLGGEGRVYSGHAGVREFFRDFSEHFDGLHWEYADIRDLGDRVLAIGTFRARGRGRRPADEHRSYLRRRRARSPAAEPIRATGRRCARTWGTRTQKSVGLSTLRGCHVDRLVGSSSADRELECRATQGAPRRTGCCARGARTGRGRASGGHPTHPPVVERRSREARTNPHSRLTR